MFVFDNGLGTLEDNDISANTLAGVEIKTGANPTLRRNNIHHNETSGVYVNEDALGTLEDNDITANNNSGVHIKTSSNPTLRRNNIHDNKAAGVDVHEERGRHTRKQRHHRQRHVRRRYQDQQQPHPAPQPRQPEQLHGYPCFRWRPGHGRGQRPKQQHAALGI